MIDYRKAVGIQVKKGRPALGEKPSKKQLQDLYIKKRKSIRTIAEELGCSKDMIYSALKEYGIERREKFKPSQLSKFTTEELRQKIKESSLRKAAAELGVDKTTLLRYLKKAENR